MKILFYTVAACAISMTVGCTAKLATRELGPEEKEWKEYIEPMYPGWKVPPTLPPAISDNNVNTNTAALNNTDAVNAAEAPLASTDTAAPDSGSSNNSNNNVDDSLAGAADKDATAAGKVRYDDYVVEKDDTLSHIAKKVYGNGKKYYRIYKANEDIIKNPNRIYPGMTIKIPRP